MSFCDYKTRDRAQEETLDLPEGIPPLRAFYLYLVNGCNLACRHCWIVPRFVDGKPHPGEAIDVEELASAIDEALPLGLQHIKLTGGEPLLHPRFREIVDMISGKDLDMNMETNGTLITGDLARYLKRETRLSFVSISLDGPDAATHESFRGVEGAFQAALSGLDHLVEAGYENVQVIMAVHRGNLHTIEEVVRLAAAHGAASVKFNPVTNTGRGKLMHQRGETLGFEERMGLDSYIFDHLLPRLRDEGLKIHLILFTPPALRPINHLIQTRGATGDCGVLGILGILGNGDIALCGIGRSIPELVYGNIGRDSIRQIWLNHPTILELRRALEDVENYPGICGECVFARRCRTGCVAQNYADSGRLVWPNGLCIAAENRNKFPITRKKPHARKTNYAMISEGGQNG